MNKEENNQCIAMNNLNLKGKTFTLENVRESQRLCNSPQDCLRYLSEVLDLEDYLTKARHAFVLDYFHGINLFVVEINLKAEQALLVFNLGNDLFCTLLDGKCFQESEEFFKTRILSLNAKPLDDDSNPIFSLIDLREIIDFFVFTFFQHHALYNYCFSRECCMESRREVVHVETTLIPPLSEALSKEELEAQELEAARETLETEEKARQEAAAKAEVERIAAEEAMKIEESKNKSQSLDEAIEFIVREKLENFKESFFEGCVSEQKRLFEKLGQLEATVTAGMPSESKTKKP